MNNNQPTKQEECLCYCSGTTRANVEALIANGVDTIEKIANETGATTGCGACDYLVMELLAENK